MSKLERQLFVAVLIFAIIVISRGAQSMNGDAPRYVATADSLLHDFDLDLRNQFDPAADHPLYPKDGDPELLPGSDGGLYPPLSIGLPVALTPVYLVADGVSGLLPDSFLERVRWSRDRAFRDILSLVLVSLYAWTMVLTLRLAKKVRPDGRVATIATVAAFVTPPLLTMSILVYPEVPAAFLCVWFVTEQLRAEPRRQARLIPLALLPWLQLRYVAISLLGVAWILSSEWHAGRRPRLLVTATALPFASLLAYWGLSSWTFDATAAPGEGGAWIVLALAGGVRGSVGILFDRDYGLLAVAPFWAFAAVGMVRLRRAYPGLATFAATSFVSLAGLAALSGNWWGGSSPPARFLVPALPLLVPALCEGLAAVLAGRARWLAIASLAWGAMMTVVFVNEPINLWTDPSIGRGLMAASFVGPRTGAPEPAAPPSFDMESFQQDVRSGLLEAVAAALDHGADPSTGLVDAVRNNHAEVLDLLLQRGGSGPNAARALAWAETQVDPRCAELLRAAGVDIDVANDTGRTALIIVVHDHNPVETRLLLAAGADPNAGDNTGRTALMEAVHNLDGGLAATLLEAGADVNATDRDGWTPLLMATRAGSIDLVEQLIDGGADVDISSDLGWSPLQVASYEGDTDVVAALVQAGADVNVSSKAGKTPLIRAAQQGDYAIVQILLAAGADLEERVDGLNALQWARLANQGDVANLLEKVMHDD